MTIEQAILGFAVVAALLTVVPGVDTALVLRSSISHSRGFAWATAAGVLVGTVVWGVAGGILGARLRSPRFMRWLDGVTGGVLLVFGVRLALDFRAAP